MRWLEVHRAAAPPTAADHPVAAAPRLPRHHLWQCRHDLRHLARSVL